MRLLPEGLGKGVNCQGQSRVRDKEASWYTDLRNYGLDFL